MNMAEFVIAKFGGLTPLARLLGHRPSMLSYWAKSGTIPTKWHSVLMNLAKENGIELSPSDFMPISVSFQKSSPSTETTVPRIPMAKWSGVLILGDDELPCYVLDNGTRVISRRNATDFLTDRRGGGNLENYLSIHALRDYLSETIAEEMIEFSLDNVVHKTVKGLSAETFLEICKAYVQALGAGALKTESQQKTAVQAAIFLSSCAKVGLIALIDEATGYQYERPTDALQLKLKAFLEVEMRKWEKTFPEELWAEFGRLTRWKGKGSQSQRPKYWGKLVIELIYEYMDKDVADWLREHAPNPRHGQNYHQWMSSQYGLQKLIQHIWLVIGISRTCQSMMELKEKMASSFGRQQILFTYYAPISNNLSQHAEQDFNRNASNARTLEAGADNMELPF